MFQSTLPTRGSDEEALDLLLSGVTVSIHAPHEGERRDSRQPSPRQRGVSIHAPHEGERQKKRWRMGRCAMFQSTLPTRGSDCIISEDKAKGSDVSIHAPHEGERQGGEHLSLLAAPFQSTLPTRGSDGGNLSGTMRDDVVSIHAPHEGERRRKSAFVCSISANLLNIIHCGTVTRAVSRRRIALFRLFSVRRSGVFMYAYASH